MASANGSVISLCLTIIQCLQCRQFILMRFHELCELGEELCTPRSRRIEAPAGFERLVCGFDGNIDVLGCSL
jgi:hypothetical protein